MALCYQYYGEVLSNAKIDSALWYYNKSLAIFSELFSPDNRDLAKIRLLIGAELIRQKRYLEAVEVSQEAIYGLIGDQYDDFLNGTPVNSIVRDIYLPDALYTKSKGLFFRYRESLNVSDLEASLANLNLALAAIEMIRSTLHDEESQLILNSNARLIIDLGLKVCDSLHKVTGNDAYLQEAYQFSEKGKALILLSALRGLEAKSTANMPDELITKEDGLLQEIALL